MVANSRNYIVRQAALNLRIAATSGHDSGNLLPNPLSPYLCQMFSVSTRVHVALFTVSLIYAAVFSIARLVMPTYIEPFGFIVLRVSVAALLFLLIHAIFIKEKITDKADFLKFFICGIFGVGANMLLFFKGLANTLPINGAILMTNTPVFVIIIAALMGRERITWMKVAGIMLASTGATLLLAGQNFNFSGDTLAGDMMVTANAIIYSFYLVYARPLFQKYHPITVSKWTFLFGTIIAAPFGFMEFTHIQWATMPAQIWGYVTFIVLGASFLTYLLNAWALKNATSSLVGSYIYLQPLLAMLIALAAGTDKPTPQKIVYMLLIFAGVYLASRNKRPAIT
jgi:drug/metabolite transporter (DMT)-like permease